MRIACGAQFVAIKSYHNKSSSSKWTDKAGLMSALEREVVGFDAKPVHHDGLDGGRQDELLRLGPASLNSRR